MDAGFLASSAVHARCNTDGILVPETTDLDRILRLPDPLNGLQLVRRVSGNAVRMSVRYLIASTEQYNSVGSPHSIRESPIQSSVARI